MLFASAFISVDNESNLLPLAQAEQSISPNVKMSDTDTPLLCYVCESVWTSFSRHCSELICENGLRNKIHFTFRFYTY